MKPSLFCSISKTVKIIISISNIFLHACIWQIRLFQIFERIWDLSKVSLYLVLWSDGLLDVLTWCLFSRMMSQYVRISFLSPVYYSLGLLCVISMSYDSITLTTSTGKIWEYRRHLYNEVWSNKKQEQSDRW